MDMSHVAINSSRNVILTKIVIVLRAELKINLRTIS